MKYAAHPKLTYNTTDRREQPKNLNDFLKRLATFIESPGCEFPSISPCGQGAPAGHQPQGPCLPTFDLVVQSDHGLRNTFSFGSIEDPASDRESHDMEHGLEDEEHEEGSHGFELQSLLQDLPHAGFSGPMSPPGSLPVHPNAGLPRQKHGSVSVCLLTFAAHRWLSKN